MKKEEKTPLYAAILIMALVPAMVVVRAWALMVLWGWFLTHLGLVAISMGHAVGVSITLRTLVQPHRVDLDDDTPWEKRLGTAVGHLVAMPIIVGLGWVVKTWWM